MLARLSSDKLVLWEAYLDIEPPAADRDDLRAALHTAAVINRLSLSDDGGVEISDLMLNWPDLSAPGDPDVAVPEDPVSEADALLAAINARFS